MMALSESTSRFTPMLAYLGLHPILMTVPLTCGGDRRHGLHRRDRHPALDQPLAQHRQRAGIVEKVRSVLTRRGSGPGVRPHRTWIEAVPDTSGYGL
jgi:hypothetical protein